MLCVARRGQRLCGSRGLRVALDQLRLQRGHPLLGGAGQLCAVAHRRELALQLGHARARGVRLLPGLREIADHGGSGCLPLLQLRLGGLGAVLSERKLCRGGLGCRGRLLGLLGGVLLELGDALLGGVGRGRAQARRGQLPLEILQQRACLVALRLRALELRGDRRGRSGLLAQLHDLGLSRSELGNDRLRSCLALLGQLLELLDAARRLGRGLDLRARLLEARALALELGPELGAGLAQHVELACELLGARRRLAQRGELRAHLLERLAKLALALARLGRLGLRGRQLRTHRRKQLLGIGRVGRDRKLGGEPLDLALELALALRALALQRVGAGCQLACALGRLLLVGPRGLQLGAHRREQLLRARRGGRCRELRGQPLDLAPQLALALRAGALERVRACRGLLLGVLRRRQLAAQRRQQLLGVRRGGRSGQLGAQPLDLSLRARSDSRPGRPRAHRRASPARSRAPWPDRAHPGRRPAPPAAARAAPRRPWQCRLRRARRRAGRSPA